MGLCSRGGKRDGIVHGTIAIYEFLFGRGMGDGCP